MSGASFEIPEFSGSFLVMLCGWIAKELTELLGDECDVGHSSYEA